MAACAVMNGAAVAFQASHREMRRDAVLVTVSAPVELSFDDLVAALFRWEPEYRNAVADDAAARELVAESVFNIGCEPLAEARDRVVEVDAFGMPGDVAWEWLAFCRQRVTELFGPAVPASGRELAKVVSA